jgi:hypothetical protein
METTVPFDVTLFSLADINWPLRAMCSLRLLYESVVSLETDGVELRSSLTDVLEPVFNQTTLISAHLASTQIDGRDSARWNVKRNGMTKQRQSQRAREGWMKGFRGRKNKKGLLFCLNDFTKRQGEKCGVSITIPFYTLTFCSLHCVFSFTLPRVSPGGGGTHSSEGMMASGHQLCFSFICTTDGTEGR